jgi:hypothetical protein
MWIIAAVLIAFVLKLPVNEKDSLIKVNILSAEAEGLLLA